MRWWQRVVVVVVGVVIAIPALTGVGQAYVPATFCDGKSESAITGVYKRGAEAVPLRCGTATYGLKHLVVRGRWTSGFDSQIAYTIARGQPNRDDGGMRYSTFTDTCEEVFRVVVNQGKIGSGGFSPQGVITAYWIDKPTTAGYRPPGESWKGKCLSYTPVVDKGGV